MLGCVLLYVVDCARRGEPPKQHEIAVRRKVAPRVAIRAAV